MFKNVLNELFFIRIKNCPTMNVVRHTQYFRIFFKRISFSFFKRGIR